MEETETNGSVADWLNETLETSSNDTLSSLDSQMTSLQSQLDAQKAETAAQVDASIEDIARSVPRLSFDLQLMREHALLLRFTLDSVRKKSMGVATEAVAEAVNNSNSNSNTAVINPSTSHVLERIRVLDKLKRRMEASRDVLREAESWSTLDSEMTAYINEQAYAKAADRLAEATKSMIVFEHTPEYESRRALLVSLQNALEASLSASLVKAISSKDTKACKAYHILFGQIQRETEFRNYYYDSRRHATLAKWTHALLTDCDPIFASPNPGSTTSSPDPSSEDVHVNSKPIPLAEFLPDFFNDLYAVLEEECAYVPQIFPDPLDTLSTFLQSAIDALSPSFHQRLGECAAYHGPQYLPLLIQCYHATEDFAVRVERLYARLVDTETGTNNTATTPTGTTATTGTRRLSHRYSVSSAKRMSTRSPSMSMSLSASSNPGYFGSATGALAKPWEVALFEPFLDFQVSYASLEKRYLSWQSQSQQTSNLWEEQELETAQNAARVIQDAASLLIVSCEEALTRSIALTHGYGSAEFVDAADAVLSEFLSSHAVGLHRSKLRRKGKNRQAMSKGGHASAISFEGLDYSSDDWSVIQLGLKLLAACRQLDVRIHGLDAKVVNRLTLVARHIADAVDTPGTTRGALSLIRQSTLYSVELSALFDKLLASTGPNLRLRLLPNTHSASNEFARACQLLLHDTIAEPLLASLSTYPSLPVWSATSNARADMKNAFDLSMPTFSLSPTELISTLGEGLFNLPRLFEIHAGDHDALAFNIQTLPFVDPSIFPPPPTASPLVGHAKRRSSFGHSTSHRQSISEGTGVVTGTGANEEALQPPQHAYTAEIVISAWLSSIATAVLTHLTSNVLPEFKTLTPHGANQLASDLSHISNVAKALDVETEDLERWRECVEMSDAEGRKAIHEHESNPILTRVAKLRHWQ